MAAQGAPATEPRMGAEPPACDVTKGGGSDKEAGEHDILMSGSQCIRELGRERDSLTPQQFPEPLLCVSLGQGAGDTAMS